MPTIRTHLLENWYASLEQSCNRHLFEVVMCGPFIPSKNILSKSNVKFIQDYGHPTRAAQIAAINCDGDALYHVVDDIVFEPNAISNELENWNHDKIISMRYKEGQNHSGHELPPHYWMAGSSYRYDTINPNWFNCVHFLMSRELFNEYGGFDCNYEYLNHATHDLLFRIQYNDQIKCSLSTTTVCSADWMPGITGDHAPIHYAQTEHDSILFHHNWNEKRPNSKILLNNYEYQDQIWKRRFKGSEKTYEELQ
jgi:hypothetical protein